MAKTSSLVGGAAETQEGSAQEHLRNRSPGEARSRRETLPGEIAFNAEHRTVSAIDKELSAAPLLTLDP